jgi:hypothetical protein
VLFGLLGKMIAVLSVVCMVLSSTDLAAQAAPPVPVTSQAAADDPGRAFKTCNMEDGNAFLPEFLQRALIQPQAYHRFRKEQG